MKKIRSFAVLNLLFLLVQVFCSYGSQAGWFAGKTMGEISDLYPSLFTPSGFTFSIWGLIYTALLVMCIRQLVFSFRFGREQESNQEVLRIGPWFILNNIFTIAWIVCWTSQQISTATVLIIGQLLTLAIIHIRLDIHERIRSLGSKALTQSPLSIYFGWINVATIANIAVYLVATGWKGAGMDFTPDTWAKIMVMVAGVITVMVVFVRSNVLFGLVLVWALWGMMKKHTEPAYADLREVIWMTMAVVAAVCAIQFIANLVWRGRTKGKVVTE